MITKSGSADLEHFIDRNTLKATIAAGSVEEDMDKFSAEDALTCQMAYYKVCL